MTDAAGTTSYKYDARGREIEEKHTIDSVDYTTSLLTTVPTVPLQLLIPLEKSLPKHITDVVYPTLYPVVLRATW